MDVLIIAFQLVPVKSTDCEESLIVKEFSEDRVLPVLTTIFRVLITTSILITSIEPVCSQIQLDICGVTRIFEVALRQLDVGICVDPLEPDFNVANDAIPFIKKLISVIAILITSV